MRTKQSKLSAHGGTNFHVNFPYVPMNLDSDETAGGNVPYFIDTRTKIDSYSKDYANEVYSPSTPVSDSGTVDLSNPTFVSSTNTISTTQGLPSLKGIDFNEEHFSLTISPVEAICRPSISFRTSAEFLVFYKLKFQCSLFSSPLCFTPSGSYYYNVGSPTTKVAGSGIPSRLNTIANEQHEFFEPLNPIPDQIKSFVWAGGTSTTEASCSISTTPISNYIKYKLLNKADWELCRVTSPALFDETFFNNLSSPTIGEAFTSGGAEYWGVFKYTGKPFSSVVVTYSASTAFTGTPTSDIVQSRIEFQASLFSAGPLSLQRNESENETSLTKTYSGFASGPKPEPIIGAPDYHCPSIILGY